MKKYIAGLLTGILIMSTTFVFGQEITRTANITLDKVKILFDGKDTKLETLLYNGKTYLPLKDTTDLIGLDLVWNGKTNTADISMSEDFTLDFLNSPTISMEEYNKLEIGMTYKETVGIIGGEGKLISKQKDSVNNTFSYMYTFEGEGKVGANATILFVDNKIFSKAEFGLK